MALLKDKADKIKGATDGTLIGNYGDELKVTDLLCSSGDNGEISVGTSPIVANVTGTNHPGRKVLKIINTGTTKLYWGFDSATATSGPNAGELIFKRSSIVIDVCDTLDVYLVSDLAGGTATIIEAG